MGGQVGDWKAFEQATIPIRIDDGGNASPSVEAGAKHNKAFSVAHIFGRLFNKLISYRNQSALLGGSFSAMF
jgi:hypothetical protein